MKNIPSCTAAILAGGKSTRMGMDKAGLTDRNGESFLEALTHQLLAFFPSVALVRRRGVYEQTALPSAAVVYDLLEQEGPLTGLHAALKNADSDYVFVLPCDTAPLPKLFLPHMTEQLARRPQDAVLVRHNGYVQPFFGFYRSSLHTDMKKAISNGMQSPTRFIQNYNIHIMDWAPSNEEDELVSLNTPNELRRYNLHHVKITKTDQKAEP